MDDETPARDPAGHRGDSSLVGRLEGELPSWLRPVDGENRVTVALSVALVAGLQLALPDKFTLFPQRWVAPAIEIGLLLTLTMLNPVRLTRQSSAGRYLSLLLVAVVSVANGASAALLDTKLVEGSAGTKAGPLLAAAASIYLTNIIAFGIWYWELDRGGPFARARVDRRYPDLLFPQMTQDHLARPDWRPGYVDYLYVSLTNSTAFSPTDTLPLTRWAKLLMALQSVVALSTTALVIARAINILK
jgi:hypothetical protein